MPDSENQMLDMRHLQPSESIKAMNYKYMKSDIMKRSYISAFLLIAIILVSGCTQSGEPVQNNTPTQVNEAPKVPIPPTPPAEEKVVYFVSAPESAIIGDFANITWAVGGEDEKTQHTAIHYDYKSHPGKFGTNVTVKSSGYTKLTPDYANGSYDLPKTFSAKIQLIQTGALYYRAQVILGNKNYWTEERNITISPKTAEVITDRRVIDADEHGFYSNNRTISAISTSFGHVIDITFNVLSSVSGGLSFRGCGQAAENVWKEDSAEYRFNANSTCNITSYDSVTNASKASLQVMVGKPYSVSSKSG